MEPIVAFFEKFVSEFSWRRLGLLVAILAVAIVGVWAYEAFTGHFRAARMQFGAEHLTRLSDPELKKNIQGDPELEQAHSRMKSDLNRFLEGSQLDLGVPEPILKAFAAAFPWILLGLLMLLFTEKGHIRGVLGGLLVVSIPFIVLGVLLPTYQPSWINYFAYPFGAVLLIMGSILLWQRLKKRPAAPGTCGEPE